MSSSQLSQGGKRRRRSVPPPARLSWPGGSSNNNSMMSMTQSLSQGPSQSSISNKKSSRRSKSSSSRGRGGSGSKNKRQRTLLESFNNNNNNNNNSGATSTNNDDDDHALLWVDRYAPTCRKELCVAPKKIQEVADFMSMPAGGGGGGQQLQPNLLILVGRPGIGKSTMVRVLAKENNTDLLEWNESYSTWSNHVESLSPLNSFQEFLQQGGVGFASLELQLRSMENDDDDNDDLHEQQRHKHRNGKLILLEELPNRSNTNLESQERFRSIFTNHIRQTNIRTIWIYSDGSEGQYKPQDLERCIDPEVLYDNSLTKIMQINPVTKTQLKKALERIAKALPPPPPRHHRHRQQRSSSLVIDKNFCEQIHLTSGGDVRYAIMSLQFDQATTTTTTACCGKSSTGSNNKKRRRGGNGRNIRNDEEDEDEATTKEGAQPEHSRDTQWTAFHALGKILYAKRKEVGTSGDDQEERPPLAFDPEGVLEHCDLDLANALTYLGFHSADFFTDIEELSTAFDLFSDASYLLEQTTNYNYQQQRRRNNNNNTSTSVSCPIFPEGYVTSLTSRSMAYANQHPAPSKFRQLQAPKIYEINRKRIDNSNHLYQLQHRLSKLSLTGSDLVSISRSGGGAYTNSNSSNGLPSFVMDRLPFLRTIAPDAVAACLDQLHSSASLESNHMMTNPDDQAAAAAKLEQEQEEILQHDDIVDYDSCEEENDKEEEQVQVALPPSSQQRTTSSTTTMTKDANLLNSQPQQTEQAEQQSVQHASLSSSMAITTARENNENRQQQGTQQQSTTTTTTTKKPIKRIVNPYSRKSSNKKAASSKSSGGSSSVRQQPPNDSTRGGGGGGVGVSDAPDMNWSRPSRGDHNQQPFVKTEPSVSVNLPLPRRPPPPNPNPPVEAAESKPTRNFILMDV